MTTNHIDQLAEWWENAEQGTPREGDRLIINEGDGDYAFERAAPGAHEEVGSIRIMSRAPKPEPAWHGAAAVIASASGNRRALIRRDEDEWTDGEWSWADDQIADVTPLIEAKVTDEMVERGLGKAEEHGYIERVFGEVDGIDQNAFRAILAAALGLETE